MNDLKRSPGAPGLLVSVRSAAEALTAIAAGADIIDVKEPNRGALGAADTATIADIMRAVDGRAIVTAAMGELADFAAGADTAISLRLPAGVSLFKIGLAGCDKLSNWRSTWREAIASLQRTTSNLALPVAVVYADWQAAGSPPPDELLAAALELGCPALLVDTWGKASGNVFNHWRIAELHAFMNRVRESQLAFVLAGSLSGESFAQAVELAPDLVAVRGAACDAGRDGTVSYDRVVVLRRMIAASAEDAISGIKNAHA